MPRGTPLRNIRVPSALWDAAKVRAEHEGTTITAVLIAALEKFVKPK